eukprot:c38980_g1_i1.p1 GENE.c38980_g1_i1~~c38980_g1_i1.p1  ORF type:complete len:402 (+),score=61.95 c38980_g1_i1:69-1208(+)
MSGQFDSIFAEADVRPQEPTPGTISTFLTFDIHKICFSLGEIHQLVKLFARCTASSPYKFLTPLKCCQILAGDSVWSTDSASVSDTIVVSQPEIVVAPYMVSSRGRRRQLRKRRKSLVSEKQLSTRIRSASEIMTAVVPALEILNGGNERLGLREFLLLVYVWRELFATTREKFLFFANLFDPARAGMKLGDLETVVLHLLLSLPRSSVFVQSGLIGCEAPPSRAVEQLVSQVFEGTGSKTRGKLTMQEFLDWVIANPTVLGPLGSSVLCLRGTFALFGSNWRVELSTLGYVHLLAKTHDLSSRMGITTERETQRISAEIFKLLPKEQDDIEFAFEALRQWLVLTTGLECLFSNGSFKRMGSSKSSSSQFDLDVQDLAL